MLQTTVYNHCVFTSGGKLNSTVDVYRQFIVDMHSYAVSKNKTLIVWEGFAPKQGQQGRSTQVHTLVCASHPSTRSTTALLADGRHSPRLLH
jgi:hypothetical protein